MKKHQIAVSTTGLDEKSIRNISAEIGQDSGTDQGFWFIGLTYASGPSERYYIKPAPWNGTRFYDFDVATVTVGVVLTRHRPEKGAKLPTDLKATSAIVHELHSLGYRASRWRNPMECATADIPADFVRDYWTDRDPQLGIFRCARAVGEDSPLFPILIRNETRLIEHFKGWY